MKAVNLQEPKSTRLDDLEKDKLSEAAVSSDERISSDDSEDERELLAKMNEADVASNLGGDVVGSEQPEHVHLSAVGKQDPPEATPIHEPPPDSEVESAISGIADICEVNTIV